MEEDIGEAADMFGRDQQGFQYPQRVYEQVGKFARGEEDVAKSLRNGRMVRSASIYVSEIRRRRAESDPRNREKNGISFRIANGWGGGGDGIYEDR